MLEIPLLIFVLLFPDLLECRKNTIKKMNHRKRLGRKQCILSRVWRPCLDTIEGVHEIKPEQLGPETRYFYEIERREKSRRRFHSLWALSELDLTENNPSDRHVHCSCPHAETNGRPLS